MVNEKRKATEIVLMPSILNFVVNILKVMNPLVRVLRLVDSEKKPGMGYIYEVIDRAKVTIMKSFDKIKDKYKEILEITDGNVSFIIH